MPDERAAHAAELDRLLHAGAAPPGPVPAPYVVHHWGTHEIVGVLLGTAAQADDLVARLNAADPAPPPSGPQQGPMTANYYHQRVPQLAPALPPAAVGAASRGYPTADGCYLFRESDRHHWRAAEIRDGKMSGKWIAGQARCNPWPGEWRGPLAAADPDYRRAQQDHMGRLLDEG